MAERLPSLQEIQAERARRKADRARASLAEFIRQGWHVLEPTTPLEWSWHHDALCLHLQALLEDWIRHQRDPSFVQRFQNFVANVPPGSLKSRIFSVYMPAWMWVHWPSWRAIFLSSNPRVALRDSVYCRDVLRSAWYREAFKPAWDFAEDQDAKGLYRNTAGGFRQAQGFSAKITGDRADALVWDDPHDADEVHSAAKREGVIERWDSAISNRVSDLRTSLRIGIMQRVHEEDLSGHVLRQGGWEHLRLPMEHEPAGCDCATCTRGVTVIGWRDPRTASGELLHAARFTPAVLAAERARGSYYYAGQFQQRPAPATSQLFPRGWWRFWREPGALPVPRPKGCDTEAPAVLLPAIFDEIIQSWDCTFKDSDGTDYVCGGVWGAKGANRFLLYRVWARLDFTSTLKEIRRVTELFPKARAKLVEDKANGSAVINTLQGEIGGIIAYNPGASSKIARAMSIQPQVEAGNVYLPEHAAWADAYVGEFETFPRGANDDQVDMTSQALLHLGEDSALARLRKLSVM